MTAGSDDLPAQQTEQPAADETFEEPAADEIPDAVVGAGAPTLWSSAGLLEVQVPEKTVLIPPVRETRSAALQVSVADTIVP